MRYSGRLLPVLLLTAAAQVYAADLRYIQAIGDAEYHHLDSQIVGRAYHVYVKLPDGYAEAVDSNFATVYVLDGGELFPLFASYYRYLHFGEEMPDSIIVGISYGGDTFEKGNYRSTDYTAPSEEREYWGGAGKFQSFLDVELLPFIENRYRANPDRRIIFGQSIGGQFVLYTALTRPQLFWGHIASNPALHRNLPFFLERHSYSRETGQSRLFVGSGTLDDPRFREPAAEWMQHWNGRKKKPWKLMTMDLEGQTHMSAPPLAFREGMRWLFANDETQ